MRSHLSGLLLVIVAQQTPAATLRVAADGSAEYTTIADALADYQNGDVVEVEPGVYSESLIVPGGVMLVSSGGSAVTILDGQKSYRQLTLLGGEDSLIQGFTFLHGWHPDAGGAFRLRDGGSATLRNCVFESNDADFDAGAIHVRHPGSTLRVENCEFRNNTTGHGAGAASVVLGGTMIIDSSSFLWNVSAYQTGGINAYDSHLEVRNSLFVGNVSTIATGAIHMFHSTGIVEYNTVHANRSPSRAAIFMNFSPTVTVRHNISSGDLDGAGLRFDGGAGPHTCNLLWSNSDGPIQSAELDASELIADPRYCDPASEIYNLSGGSPGLPGFNPCGDRIGAFGSGCGADVTIAPRDVLLASRRGDADLIIEASRGHGSRAGTPLYSLVFMLRWDPELVTIGSPELDPAHSGWTILERSEAPGQMRIAIGRETPQILGGRASSLLRASVTPMASFRSSEIEVEELRAYDGEGVPLRTFARNGVVHGSPVGAEPHGDGESGSRHELPSWAQQVESLDVAPNPFNPSTQLLFTLLESGGVSIRIFDSAGRAIWQRSIQGLPAGPNSIHWDGRDSSGSAVSSGAYLVTVRTPRQLLRTRAILLK